MKVGNKKTSPSCTLSMLMGNNKPKLKRDHDKPFVSFTQKLFEMVNDPRIDAISWNLQGDGFQVLNMSTLCDTVFPHYFKHNSWPSFTRQLNMYGFNRIGGPHHNCDANLEFKHPQFLKGSPHMLHLIHRRVVSTSDTTRNEASNPEVVLHTESLRNSNQQLTNQIHEQAIKLSIQEKTMSQVASTLSRFLETSYHPELVDALDHLNSCLGHTKLTVPEFHPSCISSPLSDYSMKLPSLHQFDHSNTTTLPSMFNRSESSGVSTRLPCLRDLLSSSSSDSLNLQPSRFH